MTPRLRENPSVSLRIEVKKTKDHIEGVSRKVKGWNVLVVKTTRYNESKIREKLVLSHHVNHEIPLEARLREANDQARAVGLIFEVSDVRLAGINDPADEAHEGDHS